MNSDERTLLVSAITYGAKAPLDAIERLGNRRTFTIMAAAMGEALERGFAEGTTVEQVRNYVAELFERFPQAKEDIDPSAIEAVIRASLGEDHLIEPLNGEQLLSAAYLLTYAIMSHENLDTDQREAFFQAVIAEADAAENG